MPRASRGVRPPLGRGPWRGCVVLLFLKQGGARCPRRRGGQAFPVLVLQTVTVCPRSAGPWSETLKRLRARGVPGTPTSPPSLRSRRRAHRGRTRRRSRRGCVLRVAGAPRGHGSERPPRARWSPRSPAEAASGRPPGGRHGRSRRTTSQPLRGLSGCCTGAVTAP